MQYSPAVKWCLQLGGGHAFRPDRTRRRPCSTHVPAMPSPLCSSWQIRELRGQVEHYREAHATVSREMEVRSRANAEGAPTGAGTRMTCVRVCVCVRVGERGWGWGWGGVAGPGARQRASVCMCGVLVMAGAEVWGLPRGLSRFSQGQCSVSRAVASTACQPVGTAAGQVFIRIEPKQAAMWVLRRCSLPQARLAEAQAATARADRLQGESAELVRRLVEMKDREADRMNEMNRLHTETVGSRGAAGARARTLRAGPDAPQNFCVLGHAGVEAHAAHAAHVARAAHAAHGPRRAACALRAAQWLTSTPEGA